MTKIQKKVSYTKIFWDIFYDEQIHNNYTNILSIEFHRTINERRTNLQWLYSGSTVALQWLYSIRKANTRTNLLITKSANKPY